MGVEELEQLRRESVTWAHRDLAEQQLQQRRRVWISRAHQAFTLQTCYTPNQAAWEACYEQDVVLTQPVTPYRSCDTSRLDQTTSRCEIIGIPALIKNAASLIVALGALAKRGLHHERTETPGTNGLRLPCDVALTYELTTASVESREDGGTFSDVVGYRRDGLMCSFTIHSRNLVRLGLLQEVAKCGTVSLKFSPDDKICRIDYSFDVMSMWRQMQNAVASRDPVLVPTTPATANRVARMPHVVTNAAYPWRIIEASAAFTELTGYSREDCVDSTLGLLLGGDATNISVVEAFVDDCMLQRPTSLEIIHYQKNGTPMRNFVQFFPLAPATPSTPGVESSCIFVVRPVV